MATVTPQFARRSLLAATVLLTLTACSGSDDSLVGAAVVVLPTDTLTAEGLRDILLLAPTVPSEDFAMGAVSIWTDFAVVSGAVAGGATLDDEATLTAVTRPVMMERTIQRYATSRAGTIIPTAAEVDSVARGNNVRVFRRYVIGPVPSTDTARIIAEGRRLIQLKEQAVSAGTPAAAMRAMGATAAGIVVSEPVASSRQEMPEQVASTIWRLTDNELSDPIVGNGGVQLFERVPAASARDQLAAWLAPVLQRRSDGRFIDSIVTGRGFAVADDGGSRMRAAALEPGTFSSDAPLATWTGGELSPTEVRGWLALMPGPERARLRGISDTTLTQTLGLMARREILFDLAVSAGVDTNAVRDELLPAFREQVAQLVADAQAAGDPTAWFRDVLEGRRQFRSLPGALAMVLRDRTEISVNDEARVAALREAARTWLAPGSAPRP